ncbi:hypothetical protein [Glaciecola sp. MH2013]|uniref:hypothetical protein n=1 Tax=Glaciecola sp. MH2013 TaxID=2785524 RepID=UPI00189C6EDC|nr:hypothetical protein [Glaciecola sp. MH2013]
MSGLRKKYIAYKYKRDDLNIIEAIPIDRFNAIIQKCISEGWEIRPEYYEIERLEQAWAGKLRKGHSTLHCSWSSETYGAINGPRPIIQSLGNEHDLQSSSLPS